VSAVLEMKEANMRNLIKTITLSKKGLVVGESLRVEVQVSEADAEVMINGIYGPKQFLQFRDPGSYTIVVTAVLGEKIEQVGKRVNVNLQGPDVASLPIIWAANNRYKPRTIVFSVANEDELANVVQYRWNFGDGASGVSQDGSISHDYTDGLVRDALYTNFDVQVDAQYENEVVATAKRTIGVFNTYALNKIQQGVLTPRVAVKNPLILPTFFFLPAQVICFFEVTNVEDEEISFTSEKHEWLTAAATDNPAGNLELDNPSIKPATVRVRERIVLESSIAGISSRPPSFLAAPKVTTMDLRLPARSTITVVRQFNADEFSGDVFGVAIHLSGEGMCSKLPAFSSAYIEVRLPMQWSGVVFESRTFQMLAALRQRNVSISNSISHENLSEHIHRMSVANVLSRHKPDGISEDASMQDQIPRPANHAGTLAAVKSPDVLSINEPTFAAAYADLINPHLIPFDNEIPVVGHECDPDNIPDNLEEGMVCQLTGEVQWRYVPGRVLNAKKGDLILDPGGPGLVGQLLRQITPPQFYSHCAIMTKNHIEMRHSTGSDDWLIDHPAL
jgi:hypothetical protein